jgi:hypothetical protein
MSRGASSTQLDDYGLTVEDRQALARILGVVVPENVTSQWLVSTLYQVSFNVGREAVKFANRARRRNMKTRTSKPNDSQIAEYVIRKGLEKVKEEQAGEKQRTLPSTGKAVNAHQVKNESAHRAARRKSAA